MKKLLATSLILSMLLCAAGCGSSATEESSSDTSTSATDATASTTETAEADEAAEAAVNEGELKAGAYAGNSEYSTDEFSMTWNYVISFNEDGTFTITDNAGEEKGAGTYALTDDCYTMTYSDDSTCTFVVQADGTLKVLNDLPYGKASISPDMVGGIVLEYSGEAVSAPEEETPTDDNEVTAGGFAIAAGAYSASYTKESPMAGTVVYNYAATIGEDGTFSYSVSFDMGGTIYDGAAASGTYSVDGDKFVFTDSEGTVTEGVLTADDTLVISLMASAMASDPYEVTFVTAE